MFISWIAGHSPEREIQNLGAKTGFLNETETATEAQMDMVMGLLRCSLMKFASEGCGLLMWHIFP